MGDVTPVIALAAEPPKEPTPGRCGSCGRFLPKDSYYTNRCSDCWGPEDEFGFYPVP